MGKITDFLFSLAPTLRTGFVTSSTVAQRVQKLRHRGQEPPTAFVGKVRLTCRKITAAYFE